LLKYGHKFDFIETFNARIRDASKNEEAEAIARALGISGICTSDAHTLQEVGISRTRIREYTSPQDFIAALREAELVPHYSPLTASLSSRLAAVAHSLGFGRS
jgi:predicted metal-dependent phosphoesterase TrpH